MTRDPYRTIADRLHVATRRPITTALVALALPIVHTTIPLAIGTAVIGVDWTACPTCHQSHTSQLRGVRRCSRCTLPGVRP